MKLIHRIKLKNFKGALFQTNWIERLILKRMIRQGRTNIVPCLHNSKLYWVLYPGGYSNVPVPNYKTRHPPLQVQPLQTQYHNYHVGGCTCEDCKG